VSWQKGECFQPGTSDASPENDGSLKLEYDGSFGGPRRKERTHEAVEVFGGTDRVRYAWKKKYAHLGVSETPAASAGGRRKQSLETAGGGPLTG
jgi:hypothetical protein